MNHLHQQQDLLRGVVGAQRDNGGMDERKDDKQSWEFIKENKKIRKHGNKNSAKKAIKKTRKQEIDQESDK